MYYQIIIIIITIKNIIDNDLIKRNTEKELTIWQFLVLASNSLLPKVQSSSHITDAL